MSNCGQLILSTTDNIVQHIRAGKRGSWEQGGKNASGKNAR